LTGGSEKRTIDLDEIFSKVTGEGASSALPVISREEYRKKYMDDEFHFLIN